MSDQIKLCRASDIGEFGTARFEVDGHALAVIRDEAGELHCIDDMCTHGNASLSQGEVEGCRVECWLHGATFDLKSGAPTPPATVPVAVYPLTIDGDDVFVRLERMN